MDENRNGWDGIKKRVHIVPTTLDGEQVGELFDEVSADRVHILENGSPQGLAEEIKELPLERVKTVIKDRTTCYKTDDVEITETDFYHFRVALLDVFRIIYRERAKGNEIYVNLAGGTKPVAIALAFAGSFADAGQLAYTAKKYVKGSNDEPAPNGAVTPAFVSPPLETIDITKTIPSKEGERTLLVGLLDAEEANIGVRDLLVHVGEVREEPPTAENDKDERTRIIQRHHRYASNLVDDGFFEKVDSAYQLTDTGTLVANLVKIMQEVDREISTESS